MLVIVPERRELAILFLQFRYFLAHLGPRVGAFSGGRDLRLSASHQGAPVLPQPGPEGRQLDARAPWGRRSGGRRLGRPVRRVGPGGAQRGARREYEKDRCYIQRFATRTTDRHRGLRQFGERRPKYRRTSAPAFRRL